ncbi:protein of unknown function [Bradyrhizobium sp. ORS 285]|nr:hypothetical protein BRAO285_2260016 [Bradyrhizobium sp. ORS 285]SMX55610.1 protein of unknown function [Bradyrhizobium sp. ORS 285]
MGGGLAGDGRTEAGCRRDSFGDGALVDAGKHFDEGMDLRSSGAKSRGTIVVVIRAALKGSAGLKRERVSSTVRDQVSTDNAQAEIKLCASVWTSRDPSIQSLAAIQISSRAGLLAEVKCI